MSKRRYLGTDLDRIYASSDRRSPAFRVVVWNKNRTTISEVVLGTAMSPEYDITKWVTNVDYQENPVFEGTEDAVASRCEITCAYDPDAQPIPITERTLSDNTPIRVYQGDKRVPQKDWIPIFTGVLRGNPSVVEFTRGENPFRPIVLSAVERSEAFLNTKVTARSYEKDTDIGRAVVETAVEFCGLDRREIAIGAQGYVIGATQAQLVDIEVLSGIYQILFTVGKKPKFDAEGFLIACDTDLGKAPIRNHKTFDLVIEVAREQVISAVNNSVRLTGLDSQLSEVVEREKRLASGTITSGFFEEKVKQRISFSESQGKSEGGRRAKNTRPDFSFQKIGEFFGENAKWTPSLEDDGYTCFGGTIEFDTGFDNELRIILLTVWAVATITNLITGITTRETGLITAAASLTQTTAGLTIASVGTGLELAAQISANGALLAILLSLSEIGRLDWKIYGEPFQNVFQQLVATAQLAGLLTEDIREIEFRNDWLYDIATLQERAKDLLDRELVKGWNYQLTLMDDPILDVDDVIEVVGRRYYVTSIRKTLSRGESPDAKMQVTAWRLT